MSRPTSKDQLLLQTREENAALIAFLETLTPEQMIESGAVGDWSVKDVLAHLTVWVQMFLRWYAAGKRGEQPITPSEDYNWQHLPALNQQIYEQHRNQPLDEVWADFHDSHQAVMSAIAAMSNEELFSPKVYAWTRSSTLGAYAVSATCSHYAWARKEIRKGMNAKQAV